ncbi:Membrane-spanning 4-domains subfamily A member 3, partial [Galemys pyrenaicus]
MASHEVDRAELGTASAYTDGAPGSRGEPEQVQDSTHQPTDTSQKDQKGELKVLGAVQILIGAMVLALGVLLGSLQYVSHLFRHFFLVYYTGYPLWGAALFISSGSLSVAAGRKPTRMLGLVSLMLLLTFLELCLTVTVSTMWCKENCCARE